MKEQSTEDNQNGNVPVSLGNMEEEVVNNKSSSNKVNRRNQSLEGNISWLLRLFRSDFFDVSLAVAYLWQYPDPGVKDYLVNELFNMPFSKLNFYIPQLVHMCCLWHSPDGALERFLLFACSHHFSFACLVICFLESQLGKYADSSVSSYARWLKQAILLEPASFRAFLPSACSSGSQPRLPTLVPSSDQESPDPLPSSECLRHRKTSSAHVLPVPHSLGILAYSQECKATVQTHLRAQLAFINALVGIGIKLLNIKCRDTWQEHLYSELRSLNLSLPARPTRVSFPLALDDRGHQHHVVRIPPEEAVILDSKDRAPFLILVEVVECDDPLSSASEGPSELFEVPSRADEGPSSQTGPQLEHPSRLLKEPWNEKVDRIRCNSPYGQADGWDVRSMIVKSGDDLRQEVLAAQMILKFKHIWEEEHLALWLHPYRIVATGSNGGLIETIKNAISLHSIKKQMGSRSLNDYFEEKFGQQRTGPYLLAQQNFVESLAGYSLICYFLKVKDRHNGNILITHAGHVVHIDFGFFLGSSPRNLGFETASFKMSLDFVEVMGGVESDMYHYFRSLMLQGFIAARRHMDKVVLLAEIMQRGSNLPCFYGGEACIKALKDRFKVSLTEKQLIGQVNTMIEDSMSSFSTKLYDNYQYYKNGIL
ncbi:phosphatidylinositol 4-kinase beta-like isoform X2 [Zophobas morio]|uniref:phosphatidylinositol 4-kinase beta-like isoform X2 n=1 Tax=Zophobas morio TaxID=2755281 RepID=UPI0030836C6D